MYSIEQINYIMYNNRTFEGSTSNFIPELRPMKINSLLEIEKKLQFINSLIGEDSFVKIDKKYLDLDKEDVFIYPEDIEKIKFDNNFTENEYQFLIKRGITDEMIDKYKLASLSSVKDERLKNIIGIKTHPILRRAIGDGDSEGIIFPLYENGNLKNITFRKLSEITRLKYGITIPGIDLWGLEDVNEGDEIWIVEGVFDMIALKELGYKAVSSSSCSLSSMNYLKILEKKPSFIHIFSDNDVAGYRGAFRSHKMFNLNRINNRVVHSEKFKDAAEHILENKLGIEELKELKITMEMIYRKEEKDFDFLEYLKSREF